MIKRYRVKSEKEISKFAKKRSDGSYSFKGTNCAKPMLDYKYIYGEAEYISEAWAVMYDSWYFFNWIIEEDYPYLEIE